MTIERIQPGDPLSATRQNALIDQVSRNTRPGTIRRNQYGTAGVTFHGPPQTLIGSFELTQAMVYPDASQPGPDEPTPYTEQAKAVWFNHGDSEYGGITNSKPQTLYHPTAFRNVGGVAVGHPPYAPGQRCFAWYNRQSGRWEIITPPLDVWRFELKDDLAPGGNATAYLVPFSGGGYSTETNVEFEVYDPLSIHRGRKKDKYSSPHNDGSSGYAKYMPDRGAWEIIKMQPHALRIFGDTTSAVETTDTTFTLSSVAVMNPIGGIITDQDPAGNVTVQNVFKWEIDSGVRVDAEWNENTDKWDAVQATCPS